MFYYYYYYVGEILSMSAVAASHCWSLQRTVERQVDTFIETNRMRKGHGPGGIIDTKEKNQTMATWMYRKDGTNIRNFEYSTVFPLFDSIRNLKIRNYLNEYRSNIFLHVLCHENRPRAIFNFLTYYEKEYNRQITLHISYMYMYAHNSLKYKLHKTNSCKTRRQRSVVAVRSLP